jgi:hypothetical protein
MIESASVHPEPERFMRKRTTALRTTTATVPAIGHDNPPAPIDDPNTASVPRSPASPVVDTTTAATPNPDDLAADILHGAQAIADYIGVDLRRAFYLLQHGYIPAVKTGATWTSTRSRLRRHFNGEQ